VLLYKTFPKFFYKSCGSSETEVKKKPENGKLQDGMIFI
jgi:hypothetical protein